VHGVVRASLDADAIMALHPARCEDDIESTADPSARMMQFRPVTFCQEDANAPVS
jgi:hypothetical protein